MGGILDFAGVPGFLANIGERDEVNTVEAEWRALVNLWWMSHQDGEIPFAPIFEIACEAGLLGGVMGDNERAMKHRLSNALGKKDGQVYAGKKITCVKDENGKIKFHRKNGKLYRLVDIGDDPAAWCRPPMPPEPESPPPDPVAAPEAEVAVNHPPSEMTDARLAECLWESLPRTRDAKRGAGHLAMVLGLALGLDDLEPQRVLNILAGWVEDGKVICEPAGSIAQTFYRPR